MNAPEPQSPARAKTVTMEPTFFRAWRGIWLLTWKNQLTWQKLPLQILGLLVMPVLIYITTLTAEKWAQRPSVFSDPAGQANNFAGRLTRAKIPLQVDQRTQMRQIFADEFTRADQAAREKETSENNPASEQLRACYERIKTRAQPLLEETQFTQLQNFARHHVQQFETVASNGPVWTRTSPFYHWLVDFYFFIVLPLHCVRFCGGLIRDELQTDTLGFLTTRPLGRGRLLTLKYLSHVGWLQVHLLIQTVLFFIAGYLREIPSLGTLLPLFLAAQFLAVFAWSALGIFLGQITKRYIAMAIGYGAIVELGIGRIPTNINNLSLTRHLKTLLAHNPALQSTYDWVGTGVPLSVGALVIAAGLFLGLAALLFTFLEYHHTAEMQK